MTPQAETAAVNASAANEKQGDRSPVVWGAKKGERISFTVMAGRLWAHVFVNREHVASIDIRPDQALVLADIATRGEKLARV